MLAAAAFPQAPPTRHDAAPGSRQEALASLGSADAAARAAGVVWIARNGAAADAAPLYERLRDESPMRWRSLARRSS